jgi:hypothetical protein
MQTLDLKKQWKHLYFPSPKKVELVDVPEFNFVMIDGTIAAGEGPGESAGFQEAMMAMYGAAYTLKFTSKLRKVDPIDYPVMALEGLWWVKSGQFDFAKKEDWQYTLMIMQPDHITFEMLADAVAQIRKKRGDNPALARLRLERFREGLCIQVMHLGPYANEPETIERMKAFMKENGLVHRGRHHEIYLGDPRLANPEKLKTVLRQPVEKAT